MFQDNRKKSAHYPRMVDEEKTGQARRYVGPIIAAIRNKMLFLKRDVHKSGNEAQWFDNNRFPGEMSSQLVVVIHFILFTQCIVTGHW